jgi:hypothetical protein
MTRLNQRVLSLGLAFGLALAAGAQADPQRETDRQRRVVTKRTETRRVVERRPAEARQVAVVSKDGEERVIHLDRAMAMMRRGYLGIGLVDLTPELRTHFGVPDEAGVMVSRVEPGSPAEKAGVKVGDILTSVDGKEIKSSWNAHWNVRSQEEGQQVPLEIWRNGKVQTLSATVEKRERAELDVAPFFFRDGKDGDRLRFRLDRDKLLKGLPEGVEVLPPPGGWKGGELPRAFSYRLGSPREAELEKQLKELEKRIAELEKQLDRRN